MKILFIGDSLTYGYGVNKNENWVNLVKKEYNLDIINAGQNGDITDNIKKRLLFYLNKEHFSYVFIMGGVNDLIINSTSEYVINNLRDMIRIVKEYKASPIIGIQTPIIKDLAIRQWGAFTDYDYVIGENEKISKWILDYCNKHNIVYIDFYTSFNEAVNYNNIYEYSIDGLHPTKEGHEIMAQIACKVFKDLF